MPVMSPRKPGCHGSPLKTPLNLDLLVGALCRNPASAPGTVQDNEESRQGTYDIKVYEAIFVDRRDLLPFTLLRKNHELWQNGISSLHRAQDLLWAAIKAAYDVGRQYTSVRRLASRVHVT